MKESGDPHYHRAEISIAHFRIHLFWSFFFQSSQAGFVFKLALLVGSTYWLQLSVVLANKLRSFVGRKWGTYTRRFGTVFMSSKEDFVPCWTKFSILKPVLLFSLQKKVFNNIDNRNNSSNVENSPRHCQTDGLTTQDHNQSSPQEAAEGSSPPQAVKRKMIPLKQQLHHQSSSSSSTSRRLRQQG